MFIDHLIFYVDGTRAEFKRSSIACHGSLVKVSELMSDEDYKRKKEGMKGSGFLCNPWIETCIIPTSQIKRIEIIYDKQ